MILVTDTTVFKLSEQLDVHLLISCVNAKSTKIPL